MNGLYLNCAELDVLARCSGIAVKAYLRIRARMDIATGLVGVRGGISYQALREWTEEAIERGSGEQVVQASMRTIRTAVEQLIRRGLLLRQKTENLVFKCCLAALASSRPKRTRHEPVRAKAAEPDTVHSTNQTCANTSNGNGSGVSAASEHDTEPDTNPSGQKPPNPTNIRDRRLKASTPQSASTDLRGGAADDDPVSIYAAAWAARHLQESPPTEAARRATSIAVLLRTQQVSVHAMHPTVLAWVEKGVCDKQILAALHLAKNRRAADGSMQPVNVGYLNACLQSVLHPPKSKVPSWWGSPAAMEAKARELGIAGARPGEEMDAFRARVAAAVRQMEGGGE